MRILYYNPTTTQKRFVPFEAIRGSAFFRRPNYDAMRLAALSKRHDFFYYDERIEDKPDFNPDVVVTNVPLNLSRYVESTIKKKWGKKAKIICYGFFSTLFPEQNRKFADSVVIGDIVNIWGTIITDPETGKTSKKGVFAGGDVATGAATVILAMGAGKVAARGIQEYLETGLW